MAGVSVGMEDEWAVLLLTFYPRKEQSAGNFRLRTILKNNMVHDPAERTGIEVEIKYATEEEITS